jgi:hypothetical protein
MSLNPGRLKTLGAFAITTLAFTACGDPEARTDLRPEGDPEVLAVLVLNDSVGGLIEAATYCAPGDEKRPSLVGLPDFTTSQVCPEDRNEAPPMLTDAAPDTWYVRIMFDELLDPTVEDLIEVFDDDNQPTGTFEGSLADTQPVILKCTGVDGAMHEVPYDGYYSPSGNNVTWPLGPSLVIKQTGAFIVSTNSNCTVEIKDSVKDKSGNAVPVAQRGPFPFKIAPIKALVIDPPNSDDPAKPTLVDVTALYGDNYYMQFNTETGTQGANARGFTGFCDRATPTSSPFSKCTANVDFAMTPEPGFCANSGAACTDTAAHCDGTDPADLCEGAGYYNYSYGFLGATRAEFGFGPIGYPETDKSYTFEIKDGAMVPDRCGSITTFGPPSVEKNTKVTVKTNKFDFKTANSIVPGNGDTVPANRAVKVSFTTPLLLAPNALGNGEVGPDLDPTSFTISPQPFSAPNTPITNAEIISTQTENDLFLLAFYQPNTEYTFTLKAGAKFKDNYNVEFLNATEKVIKFKTQPLAITASSPANGATVTKATPTSITTISFTFNAAMDVSTFAADDIEFTGAPTNLFFTTNVEVGFGAPLGTSFGGCSDLLNFSFANGLGSTTCQLVVRGVFTPGEYQIKLKAGAAIKDVLNNDYTQAADRVIKFTVKEAVPTTPVPCLGAL